MKTSFSFLSGVALLSAITVVKAQYKLTDTIIGNTFFNTFDWMAIPDPTNGRVNYVNQATAKSSNLTFASGDTFILRSDFKKVVPSSSTTGRDSVRIQSKTKYTYHVSVYDVRHMPEGCGTWPAIWETDPNVYGEIDIVEGVNSQPQDVSTFWTAPGGNCKQYVQQDLTGPTILKDCSDGCPTQTPSLKSFGTAFNQNGGGWFALERSKTFVKIWFWERNNPSVPNDVKSGQSVVQPAAWGNPYFVVDNANCNIDEQLKAHNIIINLTFCGAYAGSPQYERAGCPGTCQDRVDNNPSSFSNAYFNIASIRIYQ